MIRDTDVNSSLKSSGLESRRELMLPSYTKSEQNNIEPHTLRQGGSGGAGEGAK